MSQEQKKCPLCRGKDWIEVSRIGTNSLRNYWSEFGIDLDKDYGAIPDSLSQRRCCGCGVHFFSPMIVGASSLYEAISGQDWYYDEHKWEFSEVLDALVQERPENLLEIGCGAGNFLRQVDRLGVKAVGLEINPDGLKKCHAQGLNARDCRIDDLNEGFDAIVTFQVFEHLAEPAELISQCVNALNPGGVFIVAVPNQDGVLSEIEHNILNLPPHHVTRWSKSCFDYIAKQHGLVVEEYLEEPLTFDLYASYATSLLDKIKMRGRIFAKIYNQGLVFIHRATLAASYLQARERLAGHTHICIFRKPS